MRTQARGLSSRQKQEADRQKRANNFFWSKFAASRRLTGFIFLVSAEMRAEYYACIGGVPSLFLQSLLQRDPF